MKPQTGLRSHMILLTLILVFVLIPSTSAQQTPEVHVGSVRLSRFGDLLRELHIELTEPSLLRALKNTNPEIRYLAAMKLAEDKAVDAVSQVKEALVAEKVPRARVNIAVALGLLGDPGGRDELKRLCADQNFPPEFRLSAVRYMFDLGVEKDEGCLNAAEAIVQMVDADDHTAGYGIMALELLTRFRNLTQEESQTVLELVVHRLEDSEPVVQMEASRALVSLGNPAAIPYLEASIAREQDENIRSVLETNLKKLWEKGKQ